MMEGKTTRTERVDQKGQTTRSSSSVDIWFVMYFFGHDFGDVGGRVE